MLHLANNIKTIRAIYDESQADFATRFTSVSRAMQQSYESGKAQPDIVYLNQLSELAGLPLKALMDKPLSKEQRARIVDIAENEDKVVKKGIPILLDREENAEDIVYQKAAIIELSNQIAKILSKLQGRPVEDCLDEIKQNTSLILQNLKV